MPEQEQVRTPTRVDAGRLYRRITAGMTHTCGIDRAGQLFCWGQDLQGSLGLGVSPSSIVGVPTHVDAANDYAEVRANWFHTCAVRSNGFLSCWGRNVEGQLGVSDNNDRNVPVRVGTASDWQTVAAGHFHTCGLRSDGIYCWGKNDDDVNQLGLGAPGRRDEPTPVELPATP
jgi:hypothetical protein